MTKTDPQIERNRIRRLRWAFKRLPTKARAKRYRPKKETDETDAKPHGDERGKQKRKVMGMDGSDEVRYH